jgi:hypothetical protein
MDACMQVPALTTGTRDTALVMQTQHPPNARLPARTGYNCEEMPVIHQHKYQQLSASLHESPMQHTTAQ